MAQNVPSTHYLLLEVYWTSWALITGVFGTVFDGVWLFLVYILEHLGP